MAYDAEATQKRLDETKKAIESDKKKAAMETAGFEHAADFDQWKVLEELRKAELELRKRERERKQRAKNAERNSGLTITGGVTVAPDRNVIQWINNA